MRAFLPLMAVFTMLGCGAPLQQGGVDLLPGATERLLMARRFGYAPFDDFKRGSEVRRIASRDEVPSGIPVVVGDYVIENTTIAVYVRADSKKRGSLAGITRRDSGVIEPLRIDTQIGGEPVRYDSVTSGTDEATGAAFVQASGRLERDPTVEVATRYDVAPELDFALAHTTVATRAPREGALLVSEKILGDSIVGDSGMRKMRGDSGDVLFVPIGDAVGQWGDGTYDLELPAEESISLYSRAIAPLARRDSLAEASAVANIRGQGTGEVQASFRLGRCQVPDGRVSFVRVGEATTYEVLIARSVASGDQMTFRAPVGTYAVAFEGGTLRSTAPTRVIVKSGELGSVRLSASQIGGVSFPAWECGTSR